MQLEPGRTAWPDEGLSAAAERLTRALVEERLASCDPAGTRRVHLPVAFRAPPVGLLQRLAEELGPNGRLSLATSPGAWSPRQAFGAAGLAVEDRFFPSALVAVRAHEELSRLPAELRARLAPAPGVWERLRVLHGPWAEACVWCLRVEVALAARARRAA